MRALSLHMKIGLTNPMFCSYQPGHIIVLVYVFIYLYKRIPAFRRHISKGCKSMTNDYQDNPDYQRLLCTKVLAVKYRWRKLLSPKGSLNVFSTVFSPLATKKLDPVPLASCSECRLPRRLAITLARTQTDEIIITISVEKYTNITEFSKFSFLLYFLAVFEIFARPA